VIDYLHGALDFKSLNSCIVVDVSGVGYVIFVTNRTFLKLPGVGDFVKIYVVEIVAGIYSGVVSLYGFLTREERTVYLLIKDEVSSIGAKKSLECVNKISGSFVSFKNAIISRDQSMLKIFGFTKKIVDKLVVSLRDKMLVLNLVEEKCSEKEVDGNVMIVEAIESFVALGYKDQQAKIAVNTAYEHKAGEISLENLIRKS
jgi:Holliday junction DNA helicase RuvA